MANILFQSIYAEPNFFYLSNSTAITFHFNQKIDNCPYFSRFAYKQSLRNFKFSETTIRYHPNHENQVLGRPERLPNAAQLPK
jgi:hypothetical protein